MIYVISDLHGFPFEKTQKLLSKVNFNGDDFLYVLGDVIDRGDEGVQTLLWIMNQPNVELLLGNHEAMLLSCDFLFGKLTKDFIDSLDLDKMQLLNAWKENGGKQTIRELLALKPEVRLDIVDFLRDCRKFAFVTVGEKDYLLVHAGLGNYKKGKKLKEYYLDDLIWVRPELEDNYADEFTTVFCHTPTIYYGREYKRRIVKTATWLDIDTGASCGLSPTLLRLDDGVAFTYDEQDQIIEYQV